MSCTVGFSICGLSCVGLNLDWPFGTLQVDESLLSKVGASRKPRIVRWLPIFLLVRIARTRFDMSTDWFAPDDAVHACVHGMSLT